MTWKSSYNYENSLFCINLNIGNIADGGITLSLSLSLSLSCSQNLPNSGYKSRICLQRKNGWTQAGKMAETSKEEEELTGNQIAGFKIHLSWRNVTRVSAKKEKWRRNCFTSIVDVCSFVRNLNISTCGQSYKASTIVNYDSRQYDSRVVIYDLKGWTQQLKKQLLRDAQF